MADYRKTDYLHGQNRNVNPEPYGCKSSQRDYLSNLVDRIQVSALFYEDEEQPPDSLSHPRHKQVSKSRTFCCEGVLIEENNRKSRQRLNFTDCFHYVSKTIRYIALFYLLPYAIKRLPPTISKGYYLCI